MTPTEGATEYTTCEGLLTQSSSTWPKTSVFETVASGVSANKLVIGKPAKDVPVEKALDYVLGYTAANDVRLLSLSLFPSHLPQRSFRASRSQHRS